MDYLTRNDELILLAILKLDEEASLNRIRELLTQTTPRKWTIGNVFVSLDRLEKLRYIDPRRGAPSGKRGGKAVKFYRVTPDGIKALRATREMQDVLWNGLHDIVSGGS